MNNNGFSLLRYLRDLGLEVDLLLFIDDEIGHSSHFQIKGDTWNYLKWSPYISRLPIVNGYGHAISSTYINRILLSIAYLIRIFFKSPNAHFTKPTKAKDTKELKLILSKYDVFIGSGATPAIFDSLDFKLDIFFPYSLGVEYVNEDYFSLYRKSRNPFIKYIANQMYLKQIKGIRDTRKIINPDLSEMTINAFNEIGVKPQVSSFPLPIVYPFEDAKKEEYTKELSCALEKISRYDFVIISHSRHQWVIPKKFSSKEWKKISKNNNWLIQAYADFYKLRPNSNSILVLFEYGEDYLYSKKLSEDLNIGTNVLWLPIMNRKEIMEIVKYSSVGVGVFYEGEVMWGGAACEILSQGCPLIQRFNFESDKFIAKFGYPPPPLLSANSSESITKHLINLFDNESLRNSIASKSKDWFLEYNGHEAAKEIVDQIK